MYISNYIFILILNILNNINVILLFLIIIKKNYIYCVCVLIFNWLLLHHLSFPYHENMSSNSQFKQNCHVTGLRLGWWVEGLVKTLNPYLFFMVIYLQSKLQIWISRLARRNFHVKRKRCSLNDLQYRSCHKSVDDDDDSLYSDAWKGLLSGLTSFLSNMLRNNTCVAGLWSSVERWRGASLLPAGGALAVPPMPSAPAKDPWTNTPAPELPATRHWTVNTRTRAEEENGVTTSPNNEQGNRSTYFHLFGFYKTNQGGFYYYSHPSSPSSSHVSLYRGVFAPVATQNALRQGNVRQQHWTHRLRLRLLVPSSNIPSPRSLPSTCTISVCVCVLCQAARVFKGTVH